MSDGNVNALVLIVGAIVASLALGAAWAIIHPILKFVSRSFCNACVYPIESRLLRWLQDRATARIFGTSIEAVRIRRKADTGDH